MAENREYQPEPLKNHARFADDTRSSGEATRIAEPDARNHSVPHRRGSRKLSAVEIARQAQNARLSNPLAGYSHEELQDMGAEYVRKHQIGGKEDIRAFALGACLAQEPSLTNLPGLTVEETAVLEQENKSRWSQPKLLYLVIILCSFCAAVQVMGKR
jgi:hypothetical protein